MTNECYLEFSDVVLRYELNYEGVNSLKEKIVRLLYGKKNPVERPQILNALNKINIKINYGERVGIIGLNGSGKSTFLKVASGILKPQEGFVKIKGNIQPLIEIGAGFNPEFSGRENIYLNGAMLGFTRKQINDHEQEIIDFSELNDFIDIPVKYYSSGMAVRLAFTIATLIQPEVLLMDEMLAAGDLSFIEKAKARIEKILNHAKILVLVSHDLGLISSLTTRCIMMEKGEIILDGPTETVLDFYRERTAEKIEQQKILSEELQNLELKADLNLQKQIDDKFENESIELITNLEVQVNNNDSINPDELIKSKISFGLNSDCDELFVNLHISDRFGANIIHIRNDYSNYYFKNCKIGLYDFVINIPKNPLKSGKYLVRARIVTIIGTIQKIYDSENINLKVNEGKLNHSVIENNWVINLPNTLQ